MKHKRLISLIVLISLLGTLTPAFADESADHTPEPYHENEFPQGLKDLRRFTIITLGAMPFVTIDTMLTYSTIRWAQHDFDGAYSPNIFDTSSYSTEEQIGLLLTSLGICMGIGLIDYIVQVSKRNKEKKVFDEAFIDPQFKVLPVEPQTNNDSAKDTENIQESNETQKDNSEEEKKEQQ